MRDQAGRYRWHSAGTSFIEHDCDLANTDDIIAPDHADGISNGNTKSNTGEDSASWIKTDLRTGAALSGGGKTTWSSTRIGQFPDRIRCKWACRCGSDAAFDG